MKNPTGNKLDKLVFGMFDQMVEGADKYVTEQGSTWLIFTDEKKWVIEFTKDRTLWFNYNLFQSEFELIGKDCVNERDLIKNWFEARFLNKPKVNETFDNAANMIHNIEDTIQNGVKRTSASLIISDDEIEDTIQNGVKRTELDSRSYELEVEDTIENGVKSTLGSEDEDSDDVEDTIQNGVRHTAENTFMSQIRIEDTIENGVKDTLDLKNHFPFAIEDTIQNGVKDTLFGVDPDEDRLEDTIQNGVKEETIQGWDFKIKCDDTIQNGVRHTNLSVKVRTNRVEDTIENGVKQTKRSYEGSRKQRTKDTIENGVKEVISDEGYMNHLKQIYRAEQTIENGVKEVRTDDGMVKRIASRIRAINALDNGVKETKYRIWESLEQEGHSVTSFEITESINDAIENGVKEVKTIEKASYPEVIDYIMDHDLMDMPEIIDDVIENGVKEIKELPDKSGEFRGYGDYYRTQKDMTKPHTEYVKEVIEDSYHHKSRIEGVIRNTDKDGI